MRYFNSTFKIREDAKPLRSKTTMKRGGSKLTVKCRVCGKFFQTWPYRVRAGVKTCSVKCAGVVKRNRSVHKCAFCGKEFTRAVSQVFHRGVKYCSRACFNNGQIAEASLRPTRDKWGRTSRHADKVWQAAVRERDGCTCQRCGVYDRYVHAHHVAPRSQRPDLKHEASNGKCLCNSCHSWVHEHPIEARTLGLLSGETYELARKKLEGAEHGCSKLTADQVREVRRRYSEGESTKTLAVEFLLSRSTMSRIVNHHAYKNVS